MGQRALAGLDRLAFDACRPFARDHQQAAVVTAGGRFVGEDPVEPGQCALAYSFDDVVFDPKGSCLIAQPTP